MKRRKKPRHNWGVRNGTRSGYGEYRYGPKTPIRLALPHLTPSKILRGATRKEVLERAIEIMRDWTKTPFENEGAARAGLRVGLILRGNGWEGSDRQAAEIVAEALHLMGAERPSYEEGQPGYPLGSDYCHWCSTPIPEEDRTTGRRFCSPVCAKVAVERMSRKTTHHYGAVLRSAIRMLDAEKAEPQTCEHCQKSFQSDRKARFCSISCAGLYNAGDRVLHPIQCGICETTFKPHNHQQRYCSQSCGQRANRLEEAQGLVGVRRECAECGTSFQPTTKHSRFCSTTCSGRAGGRAYKERNRAAVPPPAQCSWCGDEYQPKIALRAGSLNHCSAKCSSDRSRVAHGVNLRDLSRRTFDHFLVLPIDEEWRRRLTPQKLDWFFMEAGRTITGEATVPRVTDGLFGSS